MSEGAKARPRGRITASARWVAGFLLILLAVCAAPVFADSQPEIPPPTVLPPASTEAELEQLPSNASMVETLAQFEADEKQKQEFLEGSAAVEERERSRALYSSLSTAAAKQLLAEKFVDQLQALNAEPVRLFSSADFIEPLGETGALVTVDGEQRLLEGSGPLQSVTKDEAPEPLDLTLEDSGAGYETANSLVDLSIPSSAAEGVELKDVGIEISQAGASQASVAEPFGEMDVFYPETETDTDLLVSPIATGVELSSQLRSEASPEILRFDLKLPPGASLRPDANAAEVIAADGSKLAIVPPPFAVDAQGTYVPVELQVEGTTLALHVAHTKRDLAYPILVDPIVQDWYWDNWYEGYNLQALSNGAWKWNTSDGPSSSWVYGSTYCIYSCWGSGRGLYMDTPSGNLPANKWGQWSYSTPNSETYLANAWVSPFWRDNHVNCSQSKYGQPYDYVGMWNETSYNRILYNRANDYGWADIESWGRAFIIGMGTSSGINIPCWRDVMGGGVMIWLEDWSRPNLNTTATKGWMDQTSIRLNVSANDSGLGVRKFKATATNKNGQTEEWWTNHSCTGLYEAPCPHTWNLNEGSQPKLNFSPANLPEGIRKLSVTAYDAPDKPSFTTNEVDIAIDHAAPLITLSGTLTEQATLGTELPTYTIRADAADGDPESSDPTAARSGVTKIVFENDGKVEDIYEPGCATQSCGWFDELELRSGLLPQGSHTLKVRAFDALGHEEKKELKYETGDTQAPSLDVNGMPQRFSILDQKLHLNSFGASGSGNGQFKVATDVAIDPTDETLWVADSGNSRIQHFDRAGTYLGQFASCNDPGSVAVDPQGDIIVACSSAGKIQKFNDKGALIKQLAGFGSGNGQVRFPLDVALDPEQNIWIADTENSRIQELNSAGEFVKTIPLAAWWHRPWGVDVAANGNVWVAESGINHRVSVFDPQGELLFRFGSHGSGPGQFERPADIELDDNGYAWVTDAVNNRVQIFDEEGTFVTQFGSKGTGEGRFNTDWWLRIAVGDGDVWVVDQGNARVQRWSIPMPIVSGYLEPISASAADGNFGTTSLALKLTNGAGETEILEQSTQECEAGACSLTADFESIDLTEKPTGPYTLTVEAEDGAGNTSTESRDFRLDPRPPEIDLGGLLAEQDGQSLGAPGGDLEITATDTNVAVSGVQEVNVERDHQPVASYPSDCSNDCREVEATYRYSALRDGAERTLQAAAEPAGATLTSLSGVSCVSATDCHAVGHYRTSSGVILTLAEHWDGEAWKVKASPNPGGALESKLESIDCASASACTAVGFFKTGSEAFSTLAMRWDGSSWAIVSTPNPAGFAKSHLYDVACPASADCWAVGKAAKKASEGENPAAMLQRWDGTKWTLVSASGLPTQLSRVSCDSTSSCFAVSGLDNLVAARWDGSAWTQGATAGLPSGGSGGKLNDVSCAAGGECVVVGSYFSNGHSAPLVQRWSGSQWSIQNAVDPVGVIPTAGEGSLDAVECPSANACTAFGTQSSGSEVMPLLEGWDGTDWALQPRPAPLEATSVVSAAVSCHDEFDCALVGSTTRAGSTKAFIEREVPSEAGQLVTVEAVDRYGNSASETIEVDVHREPGETPECSSETTTVTPNEVVTPSEAVSAVQEAVPTAIAASDPTLEETTEEKIDPSYSAPEPNLANVGNQAEGETSINPQGGFTLEGIACITPATTTTAATGATVVNDDAAIFANTAPQTDTVIRPTAGGTTVIHSLRGETSPSTFSWNITVADSADVVQLPSGAIAITEPGEVEGVSEILAPENLESPALFNDAQMQLENGYYQLAKAQTETNDEVIAVIPRPFVVLDQGGVVPAEIELKATEVPTEYNFVYTLPAFEPNFEPEPVGVGTEAVASSLPNGSCTRAASPCGYPDLNRAARYAVKWGEGRNTEEYTNYGSNDCTNFVSQILRAGRVKYMRYGIHDEHEGTWWKEYSIPAFGPPHYDDTESWRFADVLPRHLWRFGLAHLDIHQPWAWTKGNIIAADWFGSHGVGDINHLWFVVGTHDYAAGREPLLAQHSTVSYSAKRWSVVKERIEASEGNDWTRFALALKHTEAHVDAKHRTPENLYTENGVFEWR